ncbi:MAG: ABC transporter substrate-binding protein [Promethearchaeota archaeon]
MERKNIYRIFALLILVSLVPMFLAYTGNEPIPYTAAAPTQRTEWDPTGPYIDKIIFRVIVGEDIQTAALVSGQVDHLTDDVQLDYLEDLQANPDIFLSQTDRLAFGHLTINCLNYPFGITALRRAYAHCFDKFEMAQIMKEGVGYAIDSPLPPSSGIWYNNQTESFKEPNVAAAIAELDAAGFVDLDGDGVREAPDGSKFSLDVWYGASAPQWGAAFTAQEPRCLQAGLAITTTAIDWTYLSGELLDAIPRPYDAVSYAWITGTDPTLLEMFTTENIPIPNGNRCNWSNSSYDDAIETMMTAADFDTVLDAAYLAQDIIVENCPIIPFYSNFIINGQRIDKWDQDSYLVATGWGTGPMNRWTGRFVQLKEGQPGRNPTTGTGGTFVSQIGSAITGQNPLTSQDAVTNYVMANIYSEGLAANDPIEHIPIENGGLSWEWTMTELADGLQYDFTLVGSDTDHPAAYWHDMGGEYGGMVTAHDVEFSYNYIKDNMIPLYVTSIGYLNSCVALDDWHVRIISNGKSYFTFDYIAGWDILPKHIWEGVVSPITFTNPRPVGYGPFMWDQRLEGEFIQMVFWENYHFGIPGHTAAEVERPSYLALYIGVGVLVIVVVLLGSVWYLRKK